MNALGIGIMRIKKPLFLALLPLLHMLLVPSPAAPTQPSRDVLFIDIEGAAVIARKYFAAADVRAMRSRLTKHTNPRPQLPNPYGAKFVALGMFGGGSGYSALGDSLSVLWTASCKSGDCDPFTSFLNLLGKRTRVRAMISSPGYSGCAEAKLEFVEKQRARPVLSVKLSSRQFYHCPRTGRKPLTSFAVPLQ